jgi:hypothetical protein
MIKEIEGYYRSALNDDGEGSTWNIFNQGKKIKGTRYTFHKILHFENIFEFFQSVIYCESYTLCP